MDRAVFVDKDGTLVKNIPFNIDPDLVQLEANAGMGLSEMQYANYKLIIISNQPGVALGYFEEGALQYVYKKIQTLLVPFDVRLDGFYYCPHYIYGKRKPYSISCSCRKPAPGLILRAANDLNIDLSASWMVGDILDDIEAGNEAGCSTILLNNGNEKEWLLTKKRKPTHAVKDLQAAASIICTHHTQYHE
jgi:D-glycero-D-manno-heptose 1,7-bisphosphate phosphatase